MAGLYLHIPFCKSRCIYCGFYSTTAPHLRQQYVDALCHEMELRPHIPADSQGLATIETVYLGGGTPTQLTHSQLRQLFYYINKVYALQANPAPSGNLPEVTIECNPDDVTPALTALLAETPVNRVSIGVQTFSDTRLQFLHRRHTARQVYEAVDKLRHAGISNISIDLIYGFPEQTLEEWNSDISAALELQPEHLSAYCLTYEEHTPLYQLLQTGRITETNEELARQMYETLIDRLAAKGYEHYEISNFAKPNFRSRHNSSYWTGVPYIGLGAAAHSFDGDSYRSWNVSDIHDYIRAISRGECPSDGELLDADTRYNDSLTVALRTCEGLDLSRLSAHYRNYCLDAAQPLLADDLLILDKQRLRLSRRGLFVSDMIMSQLMKVE